MQIKKIFIIFTLTTLLTMFTIGILIVNPNVLSKKNTSSISSSKLINCPMLVNVDSNYLHVNEVAKPWKIYFDDLQKSGLNVLIREKSNTILPSGTIGNSCELDILSLPKIEKLMGLDFRIGYNLPYDKNYNKKNIRCEISLKSKNEVTLSNSQIYLYDGNKVQLNSIDKITPTWKKYIIKSNLNNQSNKIECWFRLTMHGKISNKTKIYMSDNRIIIE